MIESVNEVRRGRRSDVVQLAETNALAFADDPLTTWLFPDEGRRLASLRRFYRANVREMMAVGEVWCSNDLCAIAKWEPPGRSSGRLARLFRLLPVAPLMLRLGPPVRVAADALKRLEEHRPMEPHWYLSGLATRPDRQRQGLGRAVLRPVLERCDSDGSSAYLETSRQENVAYYEALGFVVVGELDLAVGGPHMWTMTRLSK